MKKSFWDICLLVMAGVAILCMLALLVAVFQVPNNASADSSILSRVATGAAGFVENHHNAVIWAAIALLVVIPVGAKILPQLHRRRWDVRSEAAQSGLHGPSILAKSNVLNASFRRTAASEHGGRTEASMPWRRVS